MIAVLSSPDAIVLAAATPILITQIWQAYQARQARTEVQTAARELVPNGGASLRDAIDRQGLAITGLADEQRRQGTVIGGVSIDVTALHDATASLGDRLTVVEDYITKPGAAA